MADIQKDVVVKLTTETSGATEGIKNTGSEIQNLEKQIDSLNTKGKAMQDSLQIGQAVVGGIAAFKGAVALAGVENEKLVQTLTQLLAAQQALEGLTRINTFLQSENIVVLKAKVVWLKLVDWWQKQSAASQALMTGGIALLIAGIGSLIYYLNQQTEALEEDTEAIKRNNEEREKTLDLMDKQIKSSQSYINRQIEVVKIEEQIKDLQAERVPNIEKIRELENKRLDLLINGLKIELISKEGLIEAEEELRIKTELYRLEQEKLRLEITKNSELETELLEKRKQTQAEKDKEFEELKRKNAKNLIEIEKRNVFAITETDKSVNDIRLENQKTYLQQFYANLKIAQEQEFMLRERDKQNFYSIQQAKLQAASQLTGALIDLMVAFDNETGTTVAFQKTLAAIQIGIDTATAISRAVASASAVGVTPIEKGIAIAGAIAVVLSNMAKAKQVLSQAGQVPNRMSAGSVNSPVSVFGSPQVTLAASGQSLNNTGTDNPTPTTITNANSSGAQKVYVLEQDITRVQNNVRFVEAVSTI